MNPSNANDLATEITLTDCDTQPISLVQARLRDSMIMVLDDELATTETIDNYLSQAGFQNVRLFNDPTKAVKAIGTIQPDIILLDIRMPKISGLEILKFLRTREPTRYIPVIVLTAAHDEKTRLTCLNAGANDFIGKPVDSRELVARISNALSFKQHTDNIKRHAESVQRELEFDALTGLRNRRSFDDYITRRMTGSTIAPLSLILFDIDKFKSINDFHGHRAGDLILKQVASVTTQFCGPANAFAARVGGDEFAVVCDQDSSSAKRLAEQIADQLLKHPVTVDDHSLSARISVGVAQVLEPTTQPAELFDCADKALYYSKGISGSHVSVYDPATHEYQDNGYLKREQRESGREGPDPLKPPEAGRILIVDDEPAITEVLTSQLRNAGFSNVDSINDAKLTLAKISVDHPDLVILDIRMPGINGLEILRKLRETSEIASIPVVVMTSSDDDRIRMAALKLQANDFLTKPANSSELVARVRNSLMVKMQHDQLKSVSARLQHEVTVRTDELYATRRETILCLARTAESRDTETGNHVIRVGKYAGIIGRNAGLDEDFCCWLELAAQLHDVGKISIPDSILYKPSKLTDDEFEVMKTHCANANRIFGEQSATGEVACTSPLLQMAARIAASHHERWDGNGYPKGLAGLDIPIEGRITAVADVFDALSSSRKYKDAFSVSKCFEILEQGRGTQFDPDILDAFFRGQDDILHYRHQLA